jgi:nitrate/nitrite-specific signal transduction histidine kinase
MSQNSIFRDELPGEKKSIINLLMTGYLVSITCLGYMAFYLFIQMGQLDRIVRTMNPQTLSVEQMTVLQERVTRSTEQLQNEMIGLAVFGTVVSIIGAFYTFNLVIRPLNRMIEYASSRGKAPMPEFKSNTELKQLTTEITQLTEQLKTDSGSNPL